MTRARRKAPTPKRRWHKLEVCDVSDPSLYTDHGLTAPDAVYRNDLYSVFVRDIGHGALHISFHRHDRAAVRDWRHFQAIKNEVAGPERCAVEVFPPESKLVDSANEYHLWVLPVGMDLPFMLSDDRFVGTQEEMQAKYGVSKARQRPWEKGIPTGLGVA